MDEIVVKIGMAFLLPVYFIFIFWFVRSRYLPRYYVKITRAENAASPYRLAGIIRRILSVVHCLLLICAIMIPLQFFFLYAIADDEDVTVCSAFKLDQSLLPVFEISGVNVTTINGAVMMEVNTSCKPVFYLFRIGESISLLFALYLVLQARNLFASLSLGKAFIHKNATRLKKIAFVIIASQVAGPLIDYFVWRSTLQHISFNTGGIQLFPPFWILEPNPVLIILGLALLVLSGVLKEAKQMSDEQRLTI